MRENYNPNPFYFVEYNEEYSYSRIVSFTQNNIQLKKIFIEVIEYFPQEIEILLKVPKDKDYKRYYGSIEKYKLTVALEKYEEFVLEDGSYQLCIKNPNNDENIALDEHGILFIYSTNDVYINLLEKNNYISLKEELIYAKPHFHQFIKDSEIYLNRFIKELELEEVE